MEAADSQLLNTSVDSEIPELNKAQEDKLMKDRETENSDNLSARLRPKSEVDYNALLDKKTKKPKNHEPKNEPPKNEPK